MSYQKYTKSKLTFEFAETFSALAANADKILRLPVQNAQGFFGAWLSLKLKITNGGTANLFLFEGSSGTNGAAVTPLNKSRLDTPPTCPVPIFVVTAPTDGTQLTTEACSLSQPAEVEGYLLKPNTNYIVRVAPTGNPNGTFKLCLNVAPSFDYLYKQDY